MAGTIRVEDNKLYLFSFLFLFLFYFSFIFLFLNLELEVNITSQLSHIKSHNHITYEKYKNIMIHARTNIFLSLLFIFLDFIFLFFLLIMKRHMTVVT